MDSAEELQSYISKLQLAVEQGRQKLLHSDGAEGKNEVSVTLPNQSKRDLGYHSLESSLLAWLFVAYCLIISNFKVLFLTLSVC